MGTLISNGPLRPLGQVCKKGVVVQFNPYETATLWEIDSGREGFGWGCSKQNWVGLCSPLPKALILFMTKICSSPCPNDDLTKHLISFL